jgi:hypothetical protein
MNSNLQTQALALPNEERALLAMALLGSLEDQASPNKKLSLAWLEIASERARQIDAGEVELIPYETVRSQAQALCR